MLVPPSGSQCTLPREAAVVACIAMPDCVAITCPDPFESHIGERGITGPICQLRSKRVADEKGHGMCRPHGCVNIGLSRLRRPPPVHNWQTLGGPRPDEPPMLNPALLILHGDTSVHRTLLPSGALHRYWPLEQDAAEQEALPPNAGMLFAIDATPLNTTQTRPRHHRPGVSWRLERARPGTGRGGGRHAGGRRRMHESL